MSKREYSVREKEIINKLNKVNSALADRKIKINYSVYNYNGIASKLEKSDLYGADVSNAVFLRVHTCDSKYMIDSVVNSYKLENEIEIEECFNTKISDIERATTEDLIEYFGNMDNHETIGIGQNKEYKIIYRGLDKNKQDIEIKAWYGKKNKYKVRLAITKVEGDGSIETTFFDKAINFDNDDYNYYEDFASQGIEKKTPDSYVLEEKETNFAGVDKFKISCVGKGDANYQIIASDKKYKKIDSVNYTGKTGNYYEYQGRIEKASGKLACRFDMENNKVVKPNFSSVQNIVDANKVCFDYYNKYKNLPIVKIDNKANKIIIQGKKSDLYKLNFDQVEDTVKSNFENYWNRGYVIETVATNLGKKYIRKK